VRIGVIGAGKIGGLRARSILGHPDTQLVAVLDTLSDAAARLAATAGARPTTDLTQFFDTPMDAVVVSSPVPAHEEACLRAFDRGLPVEIPLPAIGQVWRVCYRRTPDRSVRLRELADGVLELTGPVHDEDACRARLRQWLAATARRVLAPWLERISERTGLAYKSLQIRGQRTRWGSCSTQRTISLNYSLLFLERALVRYLLIHELCHTRHMNHGTRFWALVQSVEPQAQTLDGELGDAWRDVPAWATWY